MNAKQMQIEFERRLQLISPDLTIDNKPTSDTIFSFLNAATERYIYICFVGDDQLEGFTRGFKKNTDAIKSLLVDIELFQSGQTFAGFPRFRLPFNDNDEYLLYVKSNSKVRGTYKQYSTEVLVENEMVKYEDLAKYQTTAYNKPIIIKPAVALFSDYVTNYNYLVVAVDSYTTLDSVVLTYYRKPRKFNTITGSNIVSQCELPESEHNNIVELAVDMFISENKYKLAARNSNEQ